MAKTQPNKARHVKRRSTFRARGEGISKLDQNAAWIARSKQQRPPREERSSQVATVFDAVGKFIADGWHGWFK